MYGYSFDTGFKNNSITSGGNNRRMILTFKNADRFTPADSATYYFVQWANTGAESTESFAISVAPADMTIKAITIVCVNGAGSSENVTFDFGVNQSYTNIATGAMDSTLTKHTNYSLNIAVSAGDELNIRMVCPAWATNPTNLRFHANVYAE